jgi:hypothetical protein
VASGFWWVWRCARRKRVRARERRRRGAGGSDGDAVGGEGETAKRLWCGRRLGGVCSFSCDCFNGDIVRWSLVSAICDCAVGVTTTCYFTAYVFSPSFARSGANRQVAFAPRNTSRPFTSASIFRSAMLRLFIQKPQSGCTHLMRFGPRIFVPSAIRPAT